MRITIYDAVTTFTQNYPPARERTLTNAGLLLFVFLIEPRIWVLTKAGSNNFDTIYLDDHKFTMVVLFELSEERTHSTIWPQTTVTYPWLTTVRKTVSSKYFGSLMIAHDF